MADSPNMREQVFARLTARHGLNAAEAAAAWEEYLLYVLANQICREPAGLHIEDN